MANAKEDAKAQPEVKKVKAPMTRELIAAELNKKPSTRSQVVAALAKKGVVTTVGYVSTIVKNHSLSGLITEAQLKASEAPAEKK